jgi:hypothetical protein
MPSVKKAELIEEVVYVASPLRFRSHACPHGQLIVWLGTYEASTSGVELGIEPTVVTIRRFLDGQNLGKIS